VTLPEKDAPGAAQRLMRKCRFVLSYVPYCIS